MPYYHVKNKKVHAALENLLEQRELQHKVFRKVLRKFGCKEGYLTDSGLHGLVFPEPGKMDMKIWRIWNARRYGKNVLYPRSTKIAKDASNLFKSVPKICHKQLNASLNFEPTIVGGFFLKYPGYVYLKDKWVINIPDYAANKVRFPKGVTEITFSQYVKWGGK